MFQYKFYSPQVKRGKISSALVTCLGNRLSLRVSSQFAAKPKTKEIRKYQKNLKIEWEYSLLASFPSINDSLAKAIKNYAKTYQSFFFSYFALMRCRFETLLKRNSSATAFLWVSQNFSEHPFQGTPPDVLENTSGCLREHLRMFQRTPPDVSENTSWCFREHLRMFQRTPSDVSEKASGCFREHLRMFQRTPPDALQNTFRCFRESLRMFQRTPPNISENTSRCFREQTSQDVSENASGCLGVFLNLFASADEILKQISHYRNEDFLMESVISLSCLHFLLGGWRKEGITLMELSSIRIVLSVQPSYGSSLPEVFLGKGVLKICSKFTGEHTHRKVISIKLLCNFIHSSKPSPTPFFIKGGMKFFKYGYNGGIGNFY